MPTREKPDNARMSVGTYALHIGEDKRTLWGMPKATGELTQLAEYNQEDELSITADEEMCLLRDWIYAKEIEIRVQQENKGETDGTNEHVEQNTVDEWQNKGELVVNFSDDTIISGNVQADVMRRAVNHLIEEHDLMEKVNVPYIPGYKNALISTQPKHPNGEKMSRPRELVNGYYLEATMSRDQKKSHIRELCEMITGLDVEFDGWE